MYKVSIIIPVYNASAYIEACLAALIAQTMDGVEVILVDDHGADADQLHGRIQLL